MVTAAPSMMYHGTRFLSSGNTHREPFSGDPSRVIRARRAQRINDLDQISRSRNVTAKISTLTQALTWKKATFNRPRLVGETSECS